MIKPIFFFLFFSFSFFASSQSEEITPEYIQSLFWNHDANQFSYQENLAFNKSQDSLSRLINYTEGIFQANLNAAHSEKRMNIENGFKHVQVMDSLYNIDPQGFNDTVIVLYFLAKGDNLGVRNDPLNQLENLFIADSIAQAANNELLLSAVHHNFAHYYQMNGEFEKAIEYNTYSINYYKKMGEDQIISYLIGLNNMGIVYYQMEEYDSSIFYVNKCIAEGYGEYGSLQTPYIVLGKNYLAKKDIDKAQKYALLCEEEAGDSPDYSRNWCNIKQLSGEINLELNELELAYNYLMEAKTIADSMNYTNNLISINDVLISWVAKKYNCEELDGFFNEYQTLREQTFNETVEKKEKQLLVQFETVKKEKKIVELNEIYQKEKTRNLYILFSLIILLLITLLIINRSITKRKILRQQLTNSELEKKVTRSKLDHSITSLKDKIKTINELKQKLSAIDTNSLNFERITNILGENYIDETQWNEVIYHFDELNNNFSSRIEQRYNDISKTEIKLLILVKMGFLNKEIGDIRGITLDGVKKAKQRLRKKLGITDFAELHFDDLAEAG